MRMTLLMRNFSFGVGTAALLLAGAAMAQTPGTTQAMDSTPSYQLVGVTGQLNHVLDAASAHPGEAVKIRLNEAAKTAQGTRLEKGTILVGTVTAVTPSANGGPSSVSLDFTSAQMKDGKQIPVKVTLVGVYPSNEASLEQYGQSTMGSAPRRIASQDKFDQESAALHNVSLHSAVQDNNSGTFTQKDGNVKLVAGTFLQVGIAPASAGTNTGE